MAQLHSIDLRIAERLKDREFRREWFHAQLEADVPELFRDMREERKMTQIDLANESGMRQSAISRFEGSRDAKWKFETLVRLADALDAQLVISLIRAEDVIARYAREERDHGLGGASGGDQEAQGTPAGNKNDRIDSALPGAQRQPQPRDVNTAESAIAAAQGQPEDGRRPVPWD